MDQSSPRPSAIPRLSRLPVPRAGLHPAASRENLQQIARSQGSIHSPRLRGTQSALKIRASTSSLRRESTENDIDPSNEPQEAWGVNDDAVPRKASQLSTSVEGYGSLDLSEENNVRESGGYSEELQPASSRAPRPSLSERTMETLQNIPSSPAVRRRNSSFFNTDSPRRPSQSSRPGSGHQNDGAMGPPPRAANSRPTSSSGPDSAVPLDFRASTNTFKPQVAPLSHTPVKRPPNVKPFKTPSNVRSARSPASASAKQPSPNFSGSPLQPSSQVKSGSKTFSSRSVKPRASVNGLFRKPSMPALNEPNDLDRIGYVKKKKSTTFSNTSSEGSSVFSRASNTTAATAAADDEPISTPRKSSLALRDQIAKAKAAKRAAVAKATPQGGLDNPVIPAGTFDFGLSDDPFNQHLKENEAKGVLRKRVNDARTNGRLNIAAMGLKEIPEEVLKMYDLEFIGATDGSWAESVDLTRFVAADNELDVIADHIFPDIDARAVRDEEDSAGNQFGGLETLDLRGNLLATIPLGFRRLELLTSLNLSNNKLDNDCFQIISQISSLRDLKIAGNKLFGTLHESITSLQNLESLEIQRNELTTLPAGLSELSRLRVLNITENHFDSLPFDILSQMPLIELLAAKNKLFGTLIAKDVNELAQLQVLDISGNSVTSISDSTQLNLPALHRLSCSSNRLNNLPNMATWHSLLTILAEDNNISSIPEGFTALPKIKNVDFSSNNIKELDSHIGSMNSLDIFRLGGNPLRERKLSAMTTEDLKRALRERIAPEERTIEREADDGAFYSAQASPISPGFAQSEWPVKAGGVLDRSNTESHSLNPVIAAQIAANNTIRTLELHHNVFKEFPSSIGFFAASLTSLSLARNELTSDTFLKDDLELPALKELNLSSNTFNSVQPLIQHLKAPQLERLDISFNRLTFLPALKPHFPKLSYLFASNNTLKELLPESINGLRVVDCSCNDINSLNPRIGLLDGPGGLERLDVSGNRFRVPKYTLLEKGTEAVLAWLRDRIPANEPSSPTEML